MEAWTALRRLGSLSQSLGVSTDLLGRLDARMVDALLAVQEAIDGK